MIQRIDVTAGQFVRYGSGAEVEPGQYYVTFKRFPEKLKKSVGAVAVSNPATGKFAGWLLPCESWVRQLLDQWQPDEVRYYGRADLDDPDTVQAVLDAFKLPAALWGKLRGWQRRLLSDVALCRQLAGQYRRGIVAPLGAGKTLAGLCAASGQPAAVLAPLHLHGTWAAEADKWGLPRPKLSTYESAHKLQPVRVLILDEVLAVKNPHAQRSAKALALSAAAETVIGFTATPSSIAPFDLRWLRAVRPGSVPADEVPWRFLFGLDTRLEPVPGRPEAQHYTTTLWDHGALTAFTAPWLGTVPLDEIRGELPAVTYERIKVERPRRYDLILQGAAADNRHKALAQARQITDGMMYDTNDQAVPMGTEKLDALDALVNSTDEPVVVFSAWDCVVDWLGRHFADEAPAVLRGATGNYADHVARFQAGKTRLLIANARISTGMNLQTCGGRPTRIMAFLSNSLNPVDRTQAEGRIVRPGNTAQGVVVYDIVAPDTLDEPALDLLRKHAGESEAIVAAALAREFSRQCKKGGAK